MIVSTSHRVCTIKNIDFTDFFNVFLSGATILDDPFSALDKNTEKQIFANLKQQTKDNIVFLISHRLYLFPQMNQVIWMEDGKAVAGTHEEILEKIPEYRSLYETQSDERENAKVETENRKTVSEHTEERRSGR